MFVSFERGLAVVGCQVRGVHLASVVTGPVDVRWQLGPVDNRTLRDI